MEYGYGNESQKEDGEYPNCVTDAGLATSGGVVHIGTLSSTLAGMPLAMASVCFSKYTQDEVPKR